jgi:hypothetical protein
VQQEQYSLLATAAPPATAIAAGTVDLLLVAASLASIVRMLSPNLTLPGAGGDAAALDQRSGLPVPPPILHALMQQLDRTRRRSIIYYNGSLPVLSFTAGDAFESADTDTVNRKDWSDTCYIYIISTKAQSLDDRTSSGTCLSTT